MKKDHIPFETLDEQAIDDLLQYASYEAGSMSRIQDKVSRKINQSAHSKKTKHIFSYKKIALIAAVFIGVLGSAMAYTNIWDVKLPLISDYFQADENILRQYSAQIDGMDIQDGIEIQLLSAFTGDREIVAFFTITGPPLQSLQDNFYIASSFNANTFMGGIQVLDYDAAANTATFAITADTNDEIPKDLEITFSQLQSFAEEKSYVLNINDLFALSKDIAQSQSEKVAWEGLSGNNDLESIPNEITLLETDVLSIPFGKSKDYIITNIGILDDGLHVQIEKITDAKGNPDDIIITDDVDAFINAGEYVFNPETYHVVTATKKASVHNGQQEYMEFIFPDIRQPEQLENKKIMLRAFEHDYYSGDTQWRIAFKKPLSMEGHIEIPLAEYLPENISVLDGSIHISPLTVNIRYKTHTSTVIVPFQSSVTLYYDDGSTIILETGPQSYIPVYEENTGELLYTETTVSYDVAIIETARLKQIDFLGAVIELDQYR